MCVCVCVSLTDVLSVIFQLQLLTSWGDPYYIGLNGLEFYDQDDQKIPLSDNSILMNTHTHTHTPLNKTERLYSSNHFLEFVTQTSLRSLTA